MMKVFLGGGIYVEYVENEAVEGLYLTDEQQDNKSFFLEGPVYEALVKYVAELKQSWSSNKDEE